MAILEIKKYPDPVLKKKAAPVKKVDPSIQTLIEDMTETMYQAPGIGLAATQVGELKRIIVFDLKPREEGRNPSCLINPEIIEAEGEQVLEEGCLSVPDYYTEVKRKARITVRGWDARGNPTQLSAEGILATVLQHEIDHLDGILFIDRISSLKRALYKKRMLKKQQKEAE